MPNKPVLAKGEWLCGLNVTPGEWSHGRRLQPQDHVWFPSPTHTSGSSTQPPSKSLETITITSLTP